MGEGEVQPEFNESEFMKVLADANDLKIYTTKSVKQLLDYKWLMYGKQHHMLCFFFHILYIILYTGYVYLIYMDTHTESEHLWYTGALLLGVIYPMIYEMIQFWQVGKEDYFESTWNYLDLFF